MTPLTLHIKNMVCDRCVRAVRTDLEGIGLEVAHVQLGQAVVQAPADEPDLNQIRKVLRHGGFDLLEDHKAQIVMRIKTLIVELIQKEKLEELNVNISDYLANEIGRSYHYLSTLFSSVERITIEKYIILQKVERVKELLVYDELSLSEISYRLGYSSVQHLSNQFKKTTGLTPSHFKKVGLDRRQPLDHLHH